MRPGPSPSLESGRTRGANRGSPADARNASVGRTFVCLGQTFFVALEGFAELMRVVCRLRLPPAVLPRDLDLRLS